MTFAATSGVRAPAIAELDDLPRPTPADFPLAGLDEQELEQVLAPFQADRIQDVYSLSPLQAGMLFHTVTRPDDADYLVQLSYDLEGHLDVDTFVAAWRHVIDRHDILRTTFAWEGVPHPVQIVHRSFPMVLRQWDWRGRSAEDAEQALDDLLAEERQVGFDLRQAPPIRFDLIALADDRHCFVWHQHHILLDSWAAAIVLDEVHRTYAALRETAALPELGEPVPYSQHIEWLRNRDRTAEQDFWRKTLGGFSTPTAFPCIAPAGPDKRRHTVDLIECLPTDVTNRLRVLARRHHLTLHTVVQGLWALLLSRHCGEPDVVYGTIMTGRSTDQADLDRMVGLLVNTVPVRVQVNERRHIMDWLHQLHDHLIELRRVEHSALPEVQRCSKVGGGQRLFETIFHYTTFSPSESTAHGGLTMRLRPTYEQTGYPLGLTVALRDQLVLQMTFEPERVDEADARRLLAQYARLVTQLAERPDGRLRDLDLLTDEERGLVLGAWTGAVGEYRSQATLPELFDETATTYPDHTAVVDDTTELTYTQLFTRANQLAHLLRSHGVGTDTIVGLAIPRSTQLAVAILAIVKAGGAYLSLDPTNPPDRNRLLINDSHLTTILATTTSTTNLTPAADHCTIITLDDPTTAATIANQPTEPPPITATPLSLAQICYTSGSTGKPKGVGIQHRNIIRLTHQPTYTTYGPTETFIQLAPIAFDVSAFEIWTSLLNGSTLVMPPPGKLDVPDIAALLRRYQVTSVGLITGMFHQVIEHDIKALATVRTVLTGGDVVQPRAIATLRQTYPDIVVRACYGPTENTTITTAITITDPDTIGTRVPIGHPINHTTTYILDHNLQPVPIGVTGELYTGGDGITRGYLNHPAATAERYLPDPYSPTPGARMYRTGDYARWRPNGTIDFLGRTDNQVKIRGFRIELGEIEARLTQHPNISEAVVLAQPDHTGHKRLIAYIVPTNPNQPPTTTDIRHFIQQALPDYMTPATTIPLTHIPLNNNGKVDRKALPTTPTITQPTTTNHHLTPTERTLTTIWQKTLGLTTINPTDNFFDLGGDSILSIRIASEARQHNINITSTDLFDHQTITQLAATADKRAATSATVIAANQSVVVGPVPLTPVQLDFLTVDRPTDRFNQSALLRWHERVDPATLSGALDALVRHHDALRLRLTEHNGTWHQHIAGPEPTNLLTVIDLPGEPGSDQRAQARELAADEVQGSLDLRRGPLLRAALFRHGSDHADEVLLVVHHLAVDIVSWHFLLADLATAYRFAVAGEPVRLPAKTASFKAWAEDLYRFADSPEGQQEIQTWHDMQTPSTGLPVDHNTGANTYRFMRTVQTELTSDETDRLLRGPRRASVAQTNEVLVTALALAVHDWAGGAPTVDLESHGRVSLSEEIDVSRTVGWFTSIYPVSLALEDTSDLAGCLRSIRERMRAVPRLGIGYGVAKYLAPAGQALVGGRSELSFNYIGQSADQPGGEILFTEVPEAPGRECDLKRRRPYLIDVQARVHNGRLAVYWRYAATRHSTHTIRALADRYLRELRRLIEHTSDGVGGRPRQTRWLDRIFPGTPLLAGPMARYRVPGLSIATIEEDRVRAWGRGLTGAGDGSPITANTVFQTGSISKHVTTVAVLRLVQDGILDLDVDVNTYLRSWQMPAVDGTCPVTLRHLLGHTAGLDNLQFRYYAEGETPPSLTELLLGIPPATNPPVRPVRSPGTEYRYAHCGFAVVEQLLTDVMRRPFPDIMRSLVLDPLGMTDSSYAPIHPRSEGTVAAFGHTASGRPYQGGFRVPPLLAAGGLWATPSDLARVALEIHRAVTRDGGAVLNQRSAWQMMGGLANGYGLGTVLKTADGCRWFGHPGDSPGFRSLYAMNLDNGTGLIVFANGDGATPLLEDLLAELRLDLVMRVQGPLMVWDEQRR